MTDKETEAQKQAQKIHRWLETGLKFKSSFISKAVASEGEEKKKQMEMCEG